MIRFAAILVVMTAAVLLTSGCAGNPTDGYSTQSIYRADVSTVAVPIFENHTFVRDVEFELTDALIKEIESRTPYKVTSGSGDGDGAGHADTILLGHIRAVELDELSKSRLTGLSEEVVVGVTIDFQWKDLRNGKILVEQRNFSGHGLFVPSQPSGEPVALGRFAVAQQLARDVVGQLQAEW